jgi:hypothetical protein
MRRRVDDVAAFEAPTDGYLTFDARLGVGSADGLLDAEAQPDR